MARHTPQEAAQKWSRRLQAASEDYKSGVMSVTQAPGAKAAQSADKARMRYDEAISSGRWAQRVGSVSLGEWQQATANKGAQRLASGASAAVPKMERFMSEFLPFVESAQAEIDRMPNFSLEDSKSRAVAWIDRMSQFRRR